MHGKKKLRKMAERLRPQGVYVYQAEYLYTGSTITTKHISYVQK